MILTNYVRQKKGEQCTLQDYNTVKFLKNEPVLLEVTSVVVQWGTGTGIGHRGGSEVLVTFSLLSGFWLQRYTWWKTIIWAGHTTFWTGAISKTFGLYPPECCPSLPSKCQILLLRLIQSCWAYLFAVSQLGPLPLLSLPPLGWKCPTFYRSPFLYEFSLCMVKSYFPSNLPKISLLVFQSDYVFTFQYIFLL